MEYKYKLVEKIVRKMVAENAAYEAVVSKVMTEFGMPELRAERAVVGIMMTIEEENRRLAVSERQSKSSAYGRKYDQEVECE